LTAIDPEALSGYGTFYLFLKRTFSFGLRSKWYYSLKVIMVGVWAAMFPSPFPDRQIFLF